MLLTDILLIILIIVIIIFLTSLPSMIKKAIGEKVEVDVMSGPRRYTRNHTEAQMAPRELLVEACAPLPGGEGYVDFREVKRGWMRIKVKDMDGIFKQISGLNLKNVKVIVIEPEERSEEKEKES